MEAVRTRDLDQAQANGVDLDQIAADLQTHTDALTPFTVDGMRSQLGLREESVRVDPDRIRGLRVVTDSANGMAGLYLPPVLERLQIAPATVRRHLANLYEKLGVSSKAELDRMLRDAD